MPPRNIVRSGNAGNSSKSTKAPTPTPTGPPQLFPPGSKTPLALLNERCQHNGWEKPDIETRKKGDGHMAFAFLKKKNHTTGEIDIVKMESNPPLIMPTAQEAKHWGATYALYRFCNNLQLNRVLPEGPREYWNQLSKEHKAAPDHMAWMWNPDPFVARKAVTERQEKASAKRAAAEEAAKQDGPALTPAEARLFENVIEVRMASSLREQVEETIRKSTSVLADAVIDDNSPSLADNTHLTSSLTSLGFRPAHIRASLEFLSHTSPLANHLLSSLPPLESALEYLLLHTPEADLPTRFLPANNSSNALVSSLHSGNDDLLRRWAEEKIVKEAGFPRNTVTEAMNDPRVHGKWGLALESLGARLIGAEWSDDPPTDIVALEERDAKREEEIEAIKSVFEHALFDDTTKELLIPIGESPLMLSIIFSSDHPYPETTRLPPLYITSPSVPPYIRLHLLSRVLDRLGPGGGHDPGEGIAFIATEIVDEGWTEVEANGPPNMSDVMRHLMPPPREAPRVLKERERRERKRDGHGGHRSDGRNDKEVLSDFEASRKGSSWQTMSAARMKLPAWNSKDDIIQKLKESQVLVVVGDTGCGKTTQLPQFILDAEIAANRGAQTTILITQPRRVSAISVAARVSQERLEDGSVGYAIRGESKSTPSTKLLFCTTGVVLRRLGGGDQLDGITHMIVHERSVDGDFLLLELRELLKTKPTLKVILMSATINQATFTEYFRGAPVIEIPGFPHPVQDFYLEDIIPLIRYKPSASKHAKNMADDQRRAMRDALDSQGLDSDSITAIETIMRNDRIDYNLVAAIVSHITSTSAAGAILIFMTGVQEIRQCIDTLRSANLGAVEIFPLHANLTSDEQRRVFAKTRHRKVVVATNVAETSITIDDVVYVIDCGRLKETAYDTELGLSRLEEIPVTRAAAKQRRGRAGRTQPGECYKLFTRKQEDNMQKFPIPEMLRVPLESLSLQVKVMREDQDVKLFLGRAISPPKIAAMEKAWSTLEELGAVDEESNLTALGRHMASLPVDLRLGKMMVLGCIFRCLGPILTVAAVLSSKPLFFSPNDRRDEANKARAAFAIANSDLLTDANAYDQCTKQQGQSAIRRFCDENFIAHGVVREITSLRHDFLGSLCDLGLVPIHSQTTDSNLNVNAGNTNLLKAVILGGLWPRIAKVSMPKAVFDRVQAGTVQREHQAKEVKMFDLSGRVFLYPGSVLFTASQYKSPFLAYFSKNMTSKVFLRDATEVPMYAILLFGGTVRVNHIAGGVTIGDGFVKLKAWPRIGVLVNQLRRLLDAQLQAAIEDGSLANFGQGNLVVEAIMALLTKDGMTE